MSEIIEDNQIVAAKSTNISIPAHFQQCQYTLEVSAVEYYRIQLSWIVPELNNTYLTLMAYIKVYGNEAREALLSDKIITSSNTYYTYRYFLKSDKYLKEIDGELVISPDIKLIEFNIDKPLLSFFLLKPTVEHGVKHKYYRS